jgi:hypothetical protein
MQRELHPSAAMPEPYPPPDARPPHGHDDAASVHSTETEEML